MTAPTRFIIIHKEPIVEKIPNLKALITYLLKQKVEVTLVTCTNKTYPLFESSSPYFRQILIPEKDSKFGLPTMVKFAWALIQHLSLLKAPSSKVIVAGQGALALGSLLKKLGVRYTGFVVEYPVLDAKQEMGVVEKWEIEGLKLSDQLIFHDQIHADLIYKHLNFNKPYFTIPNGTDGQAALASTNFIHERLQLNHQQKIILHAGGFGVFFESIPLAEAFQKLPKAFTPVFHLSHDVSMEPYFQEFLKMNLSQVYLSDAPVKSDQLDFMFASCYIGIAWYNVSWLGFKAENLGLSAGKIGNYLKLGKPVIVPNFQSLNYITDYGCGIQIDSLEQLGEAIQAIDASYERFATQAVKCYQDLWYTDPYCEKIHQEL